MTVACRYWPFAIRQNVMICITIHIVSRLKEAIKEQRVRVSLTPVRPLHMGSMSLALREFFRRG